MTPRLRNARFRLVADIKAVADNDSVSERTTKSARARVAIGCLVWIALISVLIATGQLRWRGGASDRFLGTAANWDQVTCPNAMLPGYKRLLEPFARERGLGYSQRADNVEQTMFIISMTHDRFQLNVTGGEGTVGLSQFMANGLGLRPSDTRMFSEVVELVRTCPRPDLRERAFG